MINVFRVMLYIVAILVGIPIVFCLVLAVWLAVAIVIKAFFDL